MTQFKWMFFKTKVLFFLIIIKIERFTGLIYSAWYKRLKISIYLKKIKRSPFYATYSLVQSKFKKIPIINKKIFMKNFNSINTCGISFEKAFNLAVESEKTRDFSPMIGEISVGLSTGTSGNRGLFLLSDTERARWVAYMIDRVIGLSAKKRKVAFFLRANNKLYESSNSKFLSFNFFDIYKKIIVHIPRLELLNPNILIAQPSILMILAKKKNQCELNISPEKIVSVAEVLTTDDKHFIETAFKIKLTEVYQCTEGFLASSCSHGYLHFNEDFLIIEKKYLNKEKTKFHPIITDLLRTAQPIIRYELNDIISEKKICKCGNKFLAIEKIEGRSDDIFQLKNDNLDLVNVFPDILRRTIVISSNDIEDYCLIQLDETKLGLFIKSDNKNSFLLAKSGLTKLLNSLSVSNFEIIKISRNKLKLGNKKKRIINEHK